MPEQVPSRIGRYRIVGVVGQWTAGRGVPVAMGWLYRGHDTILDRDIWVKTLSPPETDGEPAQPYRWSASEAHARFEREAYIAALLCHPNIITIHEFGTHEGMPFMAFEPLEGTSLSEAMNAGLSLKAGLPLILQVLNGLEYMHRRGIIHRDIQPANIFVCTDGCAKVINLSLAKRTDPDSYHLTADGTLLGTPPYMSPEQACGGAADRPSDLFSLGCVLYEMVGGQKAFRGDTLTAIMIKIISEPRDMGPIPDGPEWGRLRSVISRALQKGTNDRYQDAAAMLADLELALKELGDSANWMPPKVA